MISLKNKPLDFSCKQVEFLKSYEDKLKNSSVEALDLLKQKRLNYEHHHFIDAIIELTIENSNIKALAYLLEQPKLSEGSCETIALMSVKLKNVECFMLSAKNENTFKALEKEDFKVAKKIVGSIPQELAVNFFKLMPHKKVWNFNHPTLNFLIDSNLSEVICGWLNDGSFTKECWNSLSLSFADKLAEHTTIRTQSIIWDTNKTKQYDKYIDLPNNNLLLLKELTNKAIQEDTLSLGWLRRVNKLCQINKDISFFIELSSFIQTWHKYDKLDKELASETIEVHKRIKI